MIMHFSKEGPEVGTFLSPRNSMVVACRWQQRRSFPAKCDISQKVRWLPDRTPSAQIPSFERPGLVQIKGEQRVRPPGRG